MPETQNVQCVYFWFVHHFRYIEVYVICISEKKKPEKVPVEIKKNNKTPFHCHTVYWYMLYFFFKLSYTVRMHMPLECHYLRTKQHGWYYSLILNQSHEFVKSATYILPARLSSFSYFCPK